MFGGNSNWRGPIWMPVNALIIRALLQYYAFYGDAFTVECPTGSGRQMTLYEVAARDRTSPCLRSSFATRTGIGPSMAGCRPSRTTRTGATRSCSTSTSTATTGPASAPAIRPAGPGSSRGHAPLRAPHPDAARAGSRAPRMTARRPSRREMGTPRYPSLYEINTRVWLTDHARSLGRPATLDDVTDAELDDLAAMGFDWVWLLSVWHTGAPAEPSRAPIPGGGGSSRRRSRTCGSRTSRARASRSRATRSIPTWAATRRSPGCASACARAGFG